MKELLYKHLFRVINGKFIWDNPQTFDLKKQNLEGRHGYAIIEILEDDISPNQWAYYFGGIIRKECMSSNCFASWSEKEIHNHLFKELRSKEKGIHQLDGTIKMVTITDDFSAYKKGDMAKYIEELIPHLNMNYGIYPKPASHYKYNKFFLDTKVFKPKEK